MSRKDRVSRDESRRRFQESRDEKRRLERENRDLVETRHPGTMRVLLRKLRKRWRDQ